MTGDAPATAMPGYRAGESARRESGGPWSSAGPAPTRLNCPMSDARHAPPTARRPGLPRPTAPHLRPPRPARRPAAPHPTLGASLKPPPSAPNSAEPSAPEPPGSALAETLRVAVFAAVARSVARIVRAIHDLAAARLLTGMRYPDTVRPLDPSGRATRRAGGLCSNRLGIAVELADTAIRDVRLLAFATVDRQQANR